MVVATFAREFRKVKALADGAIAQLDDAQLHARLDAEANSVAMLMQHMAGNMRSRWTDFLTSDGEKPWRQRDAEFEPPRWRRAALAGVVGGRLGDAVRGARRLERRRPRAHGDDSRRSRRRCWRRMARQLAHYAGHGHQIVLLAKHLRGPTGACCRFPAASRRPTPTRCAPRRRPPA